MNGIQLTFFNFAGFLVPGIVGFLSFVPLFYFVPPSSPFLDVLLSAIVADDGAVRGSSIAILFIPVIAVTFLFGVLISETASLLRSRIMSRGWFFYPSSGQSQFALLQKQGLKEAMMSEASIRQAIALQTTAGWDLYGSAARSRMCTACGFILLIAAVVYVFFSVYLSLFFFLLGTYATIIGLKRHAEYWNFVDAIAFLRVNFDEVVKH